MMKARGEAPAPAAKRTKRVTMIGGMEVSVQELGFYREGDFSSLETEQAFVKATLQADHKECREEVTDFNEPFTFTMGAEDAFVT
jgi:hypothetical protein